MCERSAFDEYLFGGGLEADANKGVAKAIAELKAAGIEPAYSSTLKQTMPVQKSEASGELVTPPTENLQDLQPPQP